MTCILGYLFKYLNKGVDHASGKFIRVDKDTQDHNELRDFHRQVSRDNPWRFLNTHTEYE
jgi:hypothetical protein